MELQVKNLSHKHRELKIQTLNLTKIKDSRKQILIKRLNRHLVADLKIKLEEVNKCLLVMMTMMMKI